MNSDTMWGIVISVVGLFFILLIAAGSFEKGENAADMRWNACINLMTEAIPDPNDDSRASFLQNCYEQKDAN